MKETISVGLNIIGGKSWLAGVTILELLVKATKLISERPIFYLLVTEKTLKDYEWHRTLSGYLAGIIFLGKRNEQVAGILGENCIYVNSLEELFVHIDVLYPMNSDVLPGYPAISWIPDFQHRHLPDNFSSSERQWRDEKFLQIAKQAKFVYFYSRAVEKDFRILYPDSKCIAKNVFYRVIPDEEWFQGEPQLVLKKYSIPPQFVICCNQFWVHKNHAVLIKALGMLKKVGKVIHLVCTGNTQDYRHREYYQMLQEQIVQWDIADQIHITGPLPRYEQIQLLRCSQFVVQPSLFEGFSLSVAECRALGKEVLLSDLPVHREHAYGVLFDPKNEIELVRKMSHLADTLPLGPDLLQEESARIHAETLAMQFAEEMREMFRTAIDVYSKDENRTNLNGNSEHLTIATSIAPHGIENQQLAIASWQKQGFKVVSLNASEEIKQLQVVCPDVEFIPVLRDARDKYGKPFVYFDDFLDYFKRTGQKICGIVNSDVHLISDKNLPAFFSSEAQGGLVFGSRVDVDHLENLQGEMYHMGFDFFFFDSALLKIFPKEEFCIGQPWWDYWLPIVALGKGSVIKRLMTPIAYHVKHPINWNPQVGTELGLRMAKYIRTAVPVTEENILSFLQFVCGIIREKSKKLNVRKKS